MQLKDRRVSCNLGCSHVFLDFVETCTALQELKIRNPTRLLKCFKLYCTSRTEDKESH